MPAAQLPAGVDPQRREQYLSDDDFARVLGARRAVFEGLAPWRRKSLLRAAGLLPAGAAEMGYRPPVGVAVPSGAAAPPVKRNRSWSRVVRTSSFSRKQPPLGAGEERPPMKGVDNFFAWMFGQQHEHATRIQPTFSFQLQQDAEVVQRM